MGPAELSCGGLAICCDSSWIFSATCLSLSACSLLWCEQKKSSNPLAMVTRTYACAPHRSQRSEAFNAGPSMTAFTVGLAS